MTNLKLGQLLFEFHSFANWVNTAKEKFAAHTQYEGQAVCVDAVGRLIHQGAGFIRADQENAFPVKVYAFTDVEEVTP